MSIADDKFEVAKKLADAACALDTAKMSWPDVDQLWYQIFAEKMYDVAEKLAGDRAEEILGVSDGSETPRLHEEGSAGPGWSAL